VNENKEIEEWYSEYYRTISVTGDPKKLAGRLMHSFLEGRRTRTTENRKILEIGANQGEHIRFVKGEWSLYVALDLRTPSSEIIADLGALNVTYIVADAHNLPFPACEFDEVIITCVLHHVENPQKVLNEVRRVLKVGGLARILIPNDPGLSYRIIRTLTSVNRAKRKSRKDELQSLHYREHRNLVHVTDFVFKNDKIKLAAFPFYFSWYDFNLLTKVLIKKIS
jgi:ubiquinone/menaquinone biosynthesis C-methylase UbiE